MLFNTWSFAIFLAIILIAYYALPRKGQNLLLLVGGYVFYGFWDWRFCGLLMLSTLIDYSCGIALDTVQDKRRKTVVIVSVVVNLLILGFFKYFNFFLDTTVILLTKMGLHPHVPTLQVILPVGVSFYTFQSLSYVIDVYRKDFKPERDFLLYAAYVTYFPQLVAGPIERAPHLLTQLRKDRTVDATLIRTGLTLILIGLFKKMAIADPASVIVDPIFKDPSHRPAVVLLQGIWLFAIQIYCDFSGYTDIARGVSRLLGIELMLNFNQPYLSRDVTEFWRRWHISLSTWLRDYLYIPLGGNRGGTLATYRNLFLTMVIGGLWHGANWTFVIWGALHGFYLAVHKFMLSRKNRSKLHTEVPPVKPDAAGSPIHSLDYEAQKPPISIAAARKPTSEKIVRKPWTPLGVLSAIATFHLVLLTWIFFRSPTFDIAWSYLVGIGSLRGGIRGALPYMATVAAFAGLVLAVDLPQYRSGDHTIMLKWNWMLRGVLVAGMILLIILLSPNNETPFIYSQF